MANALSLIPSFTAGLFVPNRRMIGSIPAQVTISEQERDEITITEHPVEVGAPISDHAFKRPSEVTIRAGWSATGLHAQNLSATGGVYGALLALQVMFEPFDLYTGKRKYSNMLIQSISVMTDEQTEYALMAEITCRQVIRVATSTTTASSFSGDPANQNNPSSNAPTQDNGDQNQRTVGMPSGSNVYGIGADFGPEPTPGSTIPPTQGIGPDYGVQTYGIGGDLGPEESQVNSTAAANTANTDIPAAKGVTLSPGTGGAQVVNFPPPPANP